MKYYLLAGEASGDLHGSNLIAALRRLDPQGQFRAWGGDLMEAAGAEIVKHYRDLAFMGFWEVATNLRTILRNLAACKEDIEAFQPDVLILIDYPGFNLRIARWAGPLPFKVFYYISPQLWAWHSSRVHGIKAHVDRMFVILPFEEAFYSAYGMKVDFVGHPLLDVIEQFEPMDNFRSRRELDDRPIIALLPGSRQQEVIRMLSVMLDVAPRFPDHQFVLAEAPSLPERTYEEIVSKKQAEHPGLRKQLGRVRNDTYNLLYEAEAALVTSGTATLETALFDVPQVVCYKGSALSYFIARRLVNVDYISLVNLIMDRKLVPELIQGAFNRDSLRRALNELLEPEKKAAMRGGYRKLRQRLGQSGASKRTARLMIQYLKS